MLYFRKNYSERKVCTTCGKMVHYQHWALHQRSHKRAEGADELYHYCDQGATCSDSRFYILISQNRIHQCTNVRSFLRNVPRIWQKLYWSCRIIYTCTQKVFKICFLVQFFLLNSKISEICANWYFLYVHLSKYRKYQFVHILLIFEFSKKFCTKKQILNNFCVQFYRSLHLQQTFYKNLGTFRRNDRTFIHQCKSILQKNYKII